MVLFDNNVLCLLLHPEAEVPNDPATSAPIVGASERVKFLVERLQSRGVVIVIPAPVMSEFLTFAAPEYLAELNQSMWFEIAPFEQRAAIEAAVALRRALAPGGEGKKLGSESSWQKIKVDRQVVAIGKAWGVTEIYSTDRDVINLARESKLLGIHVADLPMPPAEQQQQITLDELLGNSPDPSSTLQQPPALSADDDRI